ncbi:MAG: hypothetical protein HYT94_00530 [Parcubacteria group bacterium]|nr:hypothetical protein [Parcubacteria group bacterium]
MKKQTLVIGILAVAAISGGAFFLSEKTKKIPPVETPPTADTAPEPEPAELSGKIDEHLTINNEHRDVNFCGKTYKVKQILIDGVDVVQRVAEIANEFNAGEEQDVLRAKSICGEIEYNLVYRVNSGVKLSPNEIEILGPAVRNDISNSTVYILGISRFTNISIDSVSQIKISTDGEAGSVVLGTLK